MFFKARGETTGGSHERCIQEKSPNSASCGFREIQVLENHIRYGGHRLYGRGRWVRTMARYLVVAHQTATSLLLLERAEEFARDDPRAEFVLLVPETHVSHAFTCDDVETRALASRRAAEASAAFRARGLRLVRAEVGDSSPSLAIADELRRTPGGYDAIVLSTLPAGISRWLRLDLPRRTAAAHPIPVFHVAEGQDEAWAATFDLRRQLARGHRPSIERRPPKPSLLDQSRWFVAVALGLVSLHVLLMTTLAVRADSRFLAVEVLVLSVFFGMLLLGWRSMRSDPAGEAERGQPLSR